MSFEKALFVSAIVFALGGLSSSARADDPFLHHVQSGALLAYAETEAQLLYGVLVAKEFDPELSKVLLKELERTLNAAKKSVDKTRLSLGDEKLEPELTKLLDIVKRSETQLRDLTTDVEEQTGEKEEQRQDHRDELDGESPEPPKRDWSLLKNGTAWLSADIRDARASHASVAKKVKGGPLKPPPKPTGKRDSGD